MIDFAERGFDAVIHLMPFSCLPELVNRSIIPQLSEDLDMPILSISLDEQMGTANLQTRLEAFMELVKGKKFVDAEVVNLTAEVPAARGTRVPIMEDHGVAAAR